MNWRGLRRDQHIVIVGWDMVRHQEFRLAFEARFDGRDGFIVPMNAMQAMADASRLVVHLQ